MTSSDLPKFDGEQVPNSRQFSALQAPPPPAQAADNPYAVTTWGTYDEDFTTSSGQKCRVRKLDFDDVMGAGLLDKLNSLQGIVDKHSRKAEGQPPVDVAKLLKDKRTVSQFSGLINEVLCMVVTVPQVVMPPVKMSDRKNGVVYADTVPLPDKMEIFQHAMGAMGELEAFRGDAE